MLLPKTTTKCKYRNNKIKVVVFTIKYQCQKPLDCDGQEDRVSRRSGRPGATDGQEDRVSRRSGDRERPTVRKTECRASRQPTNIVSCVNSLVASPRGQETGSDPRRKIPIASLALPSRHVALAAKGALLLRCGRKEWLRRGAKT